VGRSAAVVLGFVCARVVNQEQVDVSGCVGFGGGVGIVGDVEVVGVVGEMDGSGDGVGLESWVMYKV